jgi:integrase
VEGLRLGRFPFQAATKVHLEKKRGTVVKSTFNEEERKLRYLGGVFEKLKSKGLIDTTDPRHMGRNEIQEFLDWMQDPREHDGKPLDPDTQEKYLIHLNNLLKTFRNRIIEDMKADGVKFPRASRKPIRTISLEDLRTIFEATDNMQGWHGVIARGMVSLFLATGVRPKELRLALLNDLDLGRMKFYVRHPKGEGSWASPTQVDIIRPDLVPNIQRFLKEREEWLRKTPKANAKALFPPIGHGSREFYSHNTFLRIKGKVEEISGVDFRLKDFRPTLTSMTVNGDLSLLPAMTAQLRHLDPKTTQDHYARIEEGAVGRKLAEAWKNTPIFQEDAERIHEETLMSKKDAGPMDPKKGLIEPDKYLSGYA